MGLALSNNKNSFETSVEMNSWAMHKKQLYPNVIRYSGHKKHNINGGGLNRTLNASFKGYNIRVSAKNIAADYKKVLDIIIDKMNHTRQEGEKAMSRSLVMELSQSASQHAEEMIVKFANLSRPSKSRKTLVPIGKLLQNSVSSNTKGSEINVKISISDEKQCLIDKKQMRTVFDNIILNAVQSIMNKGLIRIKVRTVYMNNSNHLLLLRGNYLKISFHDNGSGIPQNNIKKIFDPFFTTKSSNIGLGLTTALSIVNDHHGQIEVESIAGLGTTVNVYIPV